MKKIISLILMLAMLMGISAFAEEFTLFGKVPFGASKEEVESLLKEYPIANGGAMPRRAGIAYSNKKTPVVSRNAITIAGIENSDVIFAFDKNDCVYQCLYTLGTYPEKVLEDLDRDEADSMYLATLKMLTQKYGEPETQYIKAQTTYALYSFIEALDVPFTNCVEMVNATEKNAFQDLTCDKVSEWLITLENGDFILINNFIVANKMQTFNTSSYQVHILYTFIPADALAEIQGIDNWL